MFVAPLVDCVGPLVAWAWRNWGHFSGSSGSLDELITTMIQSGGESVRRIGSTIVFGTPDGGQRVLGFIDQASQQLQGIETAVRDVQAGQAMLSASLASLRTISMVTLGLSAVTPLVLAAQFRYLSTQFNDLKKTIHRLARMVEDQALSRLESGVDRLEKGIKKGDRALIEHALPSCDESRAFFHRRVRDAIDEHGDVQVVLHLTCYLAVAACASARCYIAMGHDESAAQTLDAQRDVLKCSAQYVFRRTVGSDPARFLIPHLAGEVSLEFLRSLFQQARHAGIEEQGEAGLLEEAESASRFFEAIRPGLFRKRWGWSGPKKSPLLAELRQAVASIEETNRVLSLQAFLNEAKRAGAQALQALNELEEQKSRLESPFIAWSL